MKYFTIKEFTDSEKAEELKIDNTPSAEEIKNIELLVDVVLDPLREAYGKPINVSSGYRTEALNKVVSKSKNSHHRFGMAADIYGTPNTKSENKKLFNLIRQLNLPFTQLINEYNFSWIHVSYKKDDIRKEVLATTKNGGYIRM